MVESKQFQIEILCALWDQMAFTIGVIFSVTQPHFSLLIRIPIVQIMWLLALYVVDLV